MNRLLKLLLEKDEILRQVWVTREVSSTNPHQSGLFLTPKDTNNTDSIKCVAWKSQVVKLPQMPILARIHNPQSIN
ncbi:MAG: exodeoxyribonuclease VII large subunit [Aphanizomenon sp.]|jgi:exodeoxyribonuclease VII large subunit|uniref:exodeoxyribonuclease VII large subunit n=1 Tax=Aphanizomenon TaxID=1175 RepID=UPI0035CA1A53